MSLIDRERGYHDARAFAHEGQFDAVWAAQSERLSQIDTLIRVLPSGSEANSWRAYRDGFAGAMYGRRA